MFLLVGEDITLVKVQELLKANIQRSKVIQDQVRIIEMQIELQR
jgi:hypothetical protein